MKDKVRKFLNRALIEAGYNVPDKGDISIDDLGVSSFNLMQLIVGVEGEFGIMFDFEDIDKSNFDTLDKISNIVVQYAENQAK